MRLPSPTVNNLGNLGTHVNHPFTTVNPHVAAAQATQLTPAHVQRPADPNSGALTKTTGTRGSGIHVDIMEQLKQGRREFLPGAAANGCDVSGSKAVTTSGGIPYILTFDVAPFPPLPFC